MMEEKTTNKHVQSPLFVRILHGTHIDLMMGTIILLVCMKITGILRGREQIPFLSASMSYAITLNLWKRLRRNLRKKSESSRIQAQEEDEENYKHRECIRLLREDYMKKLAAMRAEHLKQWEEFLQRQPQTRQTVYSQLSLAEYDQSSRNLQTLGLVYLWILQADTSILLTIIQLQGHMKGMVSFSAKDMKILGTHTAVIDQYWGLAVT